MLPEHDVLLPSLANNLLGVPTLFTYHSVKSTTGSHLGRFPVGGEQGVPEG